MGVRICDSVYPEFWFYLGVLINKGSSRILDNQFVLVFHHL